MVDIVKLSSSWGQLYTQSNTWYSGMNYSNADCKFNTNNYSTYFTTNNSITSGTYLLFVSITLIGDTAITGSYSLFVQQSASVIAENTSQFANSSARSQINRSAS